MPIFHLDVFTSRLYILKNNYKEATGIIPSASRDCSTYQFRCTTLSELEFH